MLSLRRDISVETTEAEIQAFLDRITQHGKYNQDKYHTPLVLRRFLVARQGDLDAAYELWENWAMWREENKPEDIQDYEVAPQLAVETINIDTKDKQGRTCILLRSRNHTPGLFPIEDMIKFTIWVLETSTERSLKTSNTHYFTAIWDCAGHGLKNLDTALVTHKPGIIHIMKEYYPECLQTLLIVNANWIFRMFWTVISPFIDERTKRKIHVLPSPAALLDHFHPHELPQDFAYVAEE